MNPFSASHPARRRFRPLGLLGAIACTASTALSIALSPTPSHAQTSTLSENVSFINTCRSSGNATLSVFADTAQTKPVGALTPFTRVTLTGLLGSGLAQIKTPLVGWVKTDTLLSNCDAKAPGTPKPTPTPKPSDSPTAKACFVVIAKDGLAARETPNGKIQTSKGGNDGPVNGSKVTTTDPVERTIIGDRIWLKVTYDSANGGTRTGWIAEGIPNAGKNIKACD